MKILIYENWLFKVAISIIDRLKDLWVSLILLRKHGIHLEVVPSYPENIAILNQQLFEDKNISLLTIELLNKYNQPEKKMK